MTNHISVGIAGSGRIAQAFHLPSLAARTDVSISVIADPDGESLTKAGQTAPGAMLVDSWEHMDLPALDAVVICAPPAQHHPITIAALQAGTGVYVEKPMALASIEAVEMVEVWRASGAVGMVGHNFRYAPVYRMTRDRLASLELGRLVAIRSIVASAPRNLPDWKTDRSTGGGAAPDLLIHHLDLIEWLTGQLIVDVSASVATVRTAGDAVSILARLNSGIAATCVASASATKSDIIEFVGTEGTLTVDRYAGSLTSTSSRDTGYSRTDRLGAGVAMLPRGIRQIVGTIAPPPERSFSLALDAFVAAVKSNSPSSGTSHPQPDFDVGLRALRLVEAVEESAVSGSSVAV